MRLFATSRIRKSQYRSTGPRCWRSRSIRPRSGIICNGSRPPSASMARRSNACTHRSDSPRLLDTPNTDVDDPAPDRERRTAWVLRSLADDELFDFEGHLLARTVLVLDGRDALHDVELDHPAFGIELGEVVEGHCLDDAFDRLPWGQP